MARIGFINARRRGTPLVWLAANPSGSLIAMGDTGYPLDDATVAVEHVFDGTAYPSLGNLIAPDVHPPTPREEMTGDMTQLNSFIHETFAPPLRVVNALQRGVCDRWTFSRHAEIPGNVVDGDVIYFEGGVASVNEGLHFLDDGDWTKLFGLATDGSALFDAGVLLSHDDGIDYTPGSDADVDIATINVTGTPKFWWDESADFFEMSKGLSVVGPADGGYTSYDLKVGDTATPDYGMIQIGNAAIGRTSFVGGNMDLKGAVLLRNIGGPDTGDIEFIFAESAGNSCRLAIPSSGIGNAMYSPRSFLMAGPSPANTAFVTVAYWQGEGIFHNLACDTDGSGADLGVQNDLEVEGDLFVDSINESTTSAGIRFAHIIVLPKASGNGIQVDTTSPTFGWRDLRAEIRTRGVGSSDPNDTTYIGNVKAYTFSVGDEAWIEFHIPHDYVKGTDIHLHFHWSHNSANVTGGSITLGADVTHAKGHDRAAFAATINPTLSPNASTTQYQHIISEIQLSAGSPSATQIDTDDLGPDGLILARVYLAANNITSSGGVPDPFIHEVDIHYQSTNIATKDKVPDFYV